MMKMNATAMVRGAMAVLIICLTSGAGALAGETIRVLMAQNIWTDAVKRFIPDFERETGIKVDWESFHEEHLSQKLTVEMTAGTDLDVFVVRPLNDLRVFTRNGWLEDLAPYFREDRDYDFGDFTPAARECTRVGGIQACIPTANETHVIYYRKDVFAEKGVMPPRTFAELSEAAKKLTDRDAGFYAVLMRGQKSGLITQFSSFIYSFGGDWFDAGSMKSTFNTPEVAKAIDYYGTLLREYGPDGAPNMSWPQMIAIFQQGKGAMYIDASGHFPMLLNPAKSNLAEKTGVVPFPPGPAGRRPYAITAMGVAMYSGSGRKDAAWKFIRYMTDKKRTTIIQGEYGYQCARQSAFADPAGTKAFPADFAAAIADGGGPDAKPYDRPLITAVQEARDILGEAVVAAILGQDFRAAQASASRKFQSLLDREK